MYEGFEEVTSDENSDTESEMDMATVLNVDEYKTGSKRMVCWQNLNFHITFHIH